MPKKRVRPPNRSAEKLTAFLPMTRAEMEARGWDELDVLLVSGDAYVDHPAFGTALIGRFLEAKGYRTGIIAQPDRRNPESITALGRPRLFTGITAGAMDSMVNLYTANRKRRSEDAYSPGGRNDLRPRRATIVYANLVRQAFPETPIVIGGIEASLRRFAHYDYWDGRIRSSILLDSGADLLVYGMGELAVLEIARRLAQARRRKGLKYIPGTVFRGDESDLPGEDRTVRLPSREHIETNPAKLIEATRMVSENASPASRRYLAQADGNRLVVGVHPQRCLRTKELDALYGLPFQRREHWSHTDPVPALEPVRFSVTVHRGCYGGCSFCSLSAHQGRSIRSRSLGSIVREVKSFDAMKEFRGTVSDLGGPTANMYGTSARNTELCESCRRVSCLFPKICPNLDVDPEPALAIMQAVRDLPGVRHVFIASGVRYDLALEQGDYLRRLVSGFVGGHLSVAPEHAVPHVLRLMHKPPPKVYDKFRDRFEKLRREVGKDIYLVPYFISSFPGCTEEDMRRLRDYMRERGIVAQQVQDFMPLPMTMATAMYYAQRSPSGKRIHVAASPEEKRKQQSYLRPRSPSRSPSRRRPTGKGRSPA